MKSKPLIAFFYIHRYKLAIAIGILVRIVIGFSFEATGDMGGWIQGGRLGLIGTSYDKCGVSCYNWPPITFRYFTLASFLDYTFSPASTTWIVYKLLSIIADVSIIRVIYLIAKEYSKKIEALFYASIYAIHPIAIYVSSYHGQRDTIWLLGTLTAILFIIKNKYVLSGVSFGLGTAVKIPSLFLAPFLFFRIAKLQNKFTFAVSAVTVFVLINSPDIIFFHKAVIDRVFLYHGWTGWWGLQGLIAKYAQVTGFEMPFDWINQANKALLYGMILLASWLLARKKEDYIYGCYIIIMVVFVFSHAFASQYLIWPLPFLVLLYGKIKKQFIVYGVLATIMIIQFYGLFSMPILQKLFITLPQQYIFYRIPYFQYPMDLGFIIWLFAIVSVLLYARQNTIIKKRS